MPLLCLCWQTKARPDPLPAWCPCSSRPYTAPRPQYSTAAMARPHTQASMFAGKQGMTSTAALLQLPLAGVFVTHGNTCSGQDMGRASAARRLLLPMQMMSPCHCPGTSMRKLHLHLKQLPASCHCSLHSNSSNNKHSSCMHRSSCTPTLPTPNPGLPVLPPLIPCLPSQYRHQRNRGSSWQHCRPA